MEFDLTPVYEDTWQGFGQFYTLIHNLTVPEHALDWIKAFYKAKEQDKGIVIEAFRGSTKTQTLNTFVAYRTGLRPEGSSLVIKSGDESAGRSSKAIASIIEHNPMWKLIFPYVVPDLKKGWGKEGYWVKDTRVCGPEDENYAYWQRKLMGPDPSFVSLSYKSKTIIGMHPSNVLLVDDIHTRENVMSDTELASVKETITSTIFFTRVPHNPWTMFIGTPWRENDALQSVKATGEYICKLTGVAYDESGKPAWPGNPIWPEYWPAEAIQREYNQDLSGGIDFARMMLCNLEAARGRNLRDEWLHGYPMKEIHPSWPVVFGIDPASTADKLRSTDRDYFCMSIGRLIPGGGVILVDGIRAHLSHGEIIDKVQSMATDVYPTFKMAIIETEGIGEQILQLLTHQTNLFIMGATTASRISKIPSTRKKGERFERQLASLFRSSRVWLSTEENEYLRTFRNEWLSWPDGEHDDTLDATFYMVYAAIMEGALVPPQKFDDEIRPWFAPKERKAASPWRNLRG
jgi:phage terminase large subunit-like protein